jgi:cytochrome c oxidase cbb3-type subunit 2
MNRPGMNDVRVLVASAAGIYACMALAMGVFPGLVLSATPPGPGVVPLSDAAARGRDVYVGEGCSYCHTQQVRPLQQDHVWGRPSTRGDYAYATPQLLGTERTGPDLSSIGARQPSAVWHLIHLYQPRALVHASIMPAYPWLYETKDAAAPGDVTVAVPPGYAPAGKVIVAKRSAQDLVAYLQELKQAPLPAAAP